jgi:hypothetical protein
VGITPTMGDMHVWVRIQFLESLLPPGSLRRLAPVLIKPDHPIAGAIEIIPVRHCDAVLESFLMQDEPGAGMRFSYKMSLEGRSGMLDIDRQRASRGKVEPGADPGVFGSQRCSGVQG